ncbi:hypothetical protein [Streptomyces sp. A1547]|uniref:TIR domain-containing protein n=1 Tax=Streptomyces sp. R33 TaxID=3238629 RepID=A0AB39Y1U6_9ACTN|nr:hypothetical protein [Streptomyces sp. A1547]
MKCDAFVSHSHRADVPLAEALQKGPHGILKGLDITAPCSPHKE